jgi:hypothetical protein
MTSTKQIRGDQQRSNKNSAQSRNNLILKWGVFILVYAGLLIGVGLGLVPLVQSRNQQFKAQVLSELSRGQELGDPIFIDHPTIRAFYQLPDGSHLILMTISLEYRKEELVILFDQQGFPTELRSLNSHPLGRLDRFFSQGVIPRYYQQHMGYRLGRFYQQLGVARTILLQGAP